MKKLLTIHFLLAFFCSTAYAQISPQEQQNIIGLQNQVLQKQNQLENEDVKKKDLKQVEKDAEEIKKTEELEEGFEELERQAGKVVQNYRMIQCFRVREIIFSPNKIFPKNLEKDFAKDYANRCLNLEQISQLSKEISDYLVGDGYITSRAEIPPQSLYSGVLNINIIESRLEDLILNDEKFFDKTQKFTAFGFVEKDRILNLKQIEPGLERMNSLRSNNAVMKIIPGHQENYSIVAIENTPKDRTNLSLSYDNNGNKRTGARRETIALSQDNLFWLNDNFSLQRTANDLDQSRKKTGGNNALSGSFSIPFLQNNLSLSYSKSSYFFFSGNVQSFKSSGDTSTKTVALSRILLKNKKTKLSSGVSLTQRYSQNFIDDVKIQTSSRKASIASINFSQTFFLDNASLFLKPSYSKALNILDAQEDLPGVSSRGAHAEFDIFKFYGNYSQKFTVLARPFSYNLTFDSQISQQRLYGIDQFSVGGIYSVRGFSNSSISGDSGYNIRNEFAIGLDQILPKNNWQLNRFSLSPFYDYGYVRTKGGSQSGRISGGGVRISFNHKNFNAALTFSRAISKSHIIQPQFYRDDNAVFFTIGSAVNFN